MSAPHTEHNLYSTVYTSILATPLQMEGGLAARRQSYALLKYRNVYELVENRKMGLTGKRLEEACVLPSDMHMAHTHSSIPVPASYAHAARCWGDKFKTSERFIFMRCKLYAQHPAIHRSEPSFNPLRPSIQELEVRECTISIHSRCLSCTIVQVRAAAHNLNRMSISDLY